MLSALPAIIAAIAALSGVALGQWLQVRRDAVQYARGIEREARQAVREDKTRFSEERQRAYAECLKDFDHFERILDNIDIARGGGPASADRQLGHPYPDWVTKELDDEYELLFRKMGAHHSYLELIAPASVAKAVFDAQEAWDVEGRNDLMDDGFDIARIRNARKNLIAKMKADLDSPETVE